MSNVQRSCLQFLSHLHLRATRVALNRQQTAPMADDPAAKRPRLLKHQLVKRLQMQGLETRNLRLLELLTAANAAGLLELAAPPQVVQL